MNYFCSNCVTTAAVQTDCPACGHPMKLASLGSTFILEIIDLGMSSIADDLVIYERRGPFPGIEVAMQWWTRHEQLRKYFGCSMSLEELMAPTESAQLAVKNREN